MSFQDLVELLDALRGEKGCPWDKQQTLDSLKPFLIEEAYEVIEAIEHDDPEKLKEELGDLLFHIVFLSKVSADKGKFDIEDVVEFARAKMRRRHPHVFGTSSEDATAREPNLAAEADVETNALAAQAEGTRSEPSAHASRQSAAQVLNHWYEIKQQERQSKGLTSLMDSIPHNLPALQRAQKVQRRAAQVGFDWEKPEDVLEKISEETDELREALARREAHHVAEELGDLLFSVVNLSRLAEVDAEGALRGTISKFMRRFREMERRVRAGGRDLTQLSLAKMDAIWDEIKKEGNERGKGNGERADSAAAQGGCE